MVIVIMVTRSQKSSNNDGSGIFVIIATMPIITLWPWLL